MSAILTIAPTSKTQYSAAHVGQGNDQYADLLDAHGLKYTVSGIYLQVGPVRPAGWVLDLSILVTQVWEVLEKILPILKKEHVSFCVPVDANVAVHLMSAEFGYHQLGKIVMIFPGDEASAQRLAVSLVTATRTINGPAIPTDSYLGGAVYTRYGINNTIPFSMPAGLKWPFGLVAPPQKFKEPKWYNRKYRMMDRIKADVKGDVIKAINLKYWYKFQFSWCLVKQGKKYMSFDQQGRTIKDRLLHQQQLQTDLQGIVPVPKVIDAFEQNGDTYLVMDYIEGSLLHDYQVSQFDSAIWWSLHPEKKKGLLHYLEQILQIVDALHNRGIIHRDITPANFIVDQQGKLWLIDMELSYGKMYFNEAPPFSYGTDGFMSPEQNRVSTPTEKEDIFALGGLIITFVVGLSPARLFVRDEGLFTEHLSFFTKDGELARLIASCMRDNPLERPTLHQINQVISRFKRQCLSWAWDDQVTISPGEIRKAIQSCLASFVEGKLAGPDGIWYSRPDERQNQVANKTGERSVQMGFYSGISGTAYTIAKMEEAGFDISGINMVIKCNWDYLQQNYLEKLSSLSPGLYRGSTGLAVALATCIKRGMIIDNDQTRGLLIGLFQIRTDDLTIGNGLAGIGLGLLHCRSLVPQQVSGPVMQDLARYILARQEKDGSWIFTNDDHPGMKMKFPGFSHGVAGITYFLLSYYESTKDAAIGAAAAAALDWLEKQAVDNQGVLQWKIHERTSIIDQWVDVGVAGIVLAFLKAYEIFKDEKYKLVAENALNSFPAYMLVPNFSLMTGMAGLGIVYLQAHRILKHRIWQERADHIANCLLNCYNTYEENGSIVWLTVHSNLPTADLMTGNSGIIYFLTHYAHPELLTQSFPF